MAFISRIVFFPEGFLGFSSCFLFSIAFPCFAAPRSRLSGSAPIGEFDGKFLLNF